MESSNYIVSQLSLLIIVRDFVVDKKMTMTFLSNNFQKHFSRRDAQFVHLQHG